MGREEEEGAIEPPKDVWPLWGGGWLPGSFPFSQGAVDEARAGWFYMLRSWLLECSGFWLSWRRRAFRSAWPAGRWGPVKIVVVVEQDYCRGA